MEQSTRKSQADATRIDSLGGLDPPFDSKSGRGHRRRTFISGAAGAVAGGFVTYVKPRVAVAQSCPSLSALISCARARPAPELAAIYHAALDPTAAKLPELEGKIRMLGLPPADESALITMERDCLNQAAQIANDILNAAQPQGLQNSLALQAGFVQVNAFIDQLDGRGFPVTATFRTVIVNLSAPLLSVGWWAVIKVIASLIGVIISILQWLFDDDPVDPEIVADRLLEELCKVVDNSKLDEDGIETVAEAAAKGAKFGVTDPNAENVRTACNRTVAKLQNKENNEPNADRKRRIARARAGLARGWTTG